MGLFDFLAEAALMPVKITATVAKTAVRTTAKVVQGDVDGATRAVEKGIEESGQAIDDIAKAADD